MKILYQYFVYFKIMKISYNKKRGTGQYDGTPKSILY